MYQEARKQLTPTWPGGAGHGCSARQAGSPVPASSSSGHAGRSQLTHSVDAIFGAFCCVPAELVRHCICFTGLGRRVSNSSRRRSCLPSSMLVVVVACCLLLHAGCCLQVITRRSGNLARSHSSIDQADDSNRCPLLLVDATEL